MNNIELLIRSIWFPVLVTALFGFALGAIGLGTVFVTGYKNERDPSLADRLKLRAKGLKFIVFGLVAAFAGLLCLSSGLSSLFAKKALVVVKIGLDPAPGSNGGNLVVPSPKEATPLKDVAPEAVAGDTPARLSPEDLQRFIASVESVSGKFAGLQRVCSTYSNFAKAVANEGVYQQLNQKIYEDIRANGKETTDEYRKMLALLHQVPLQPALSTSYYNPVEVASEIQEKIVPGLLTLDDVKKIAQMHLAIDADIPAVAGQTLRLMLVREQLGDVLAVKMQDVSGTWSEMRSRCDDKAGVEADAFRAAAAKRYSELPEVIAANAETRRRQQAEAAEMAIKAEKLRKYVELQQNFLAEHAKVPGIIVRPSGVQFYRISEGIGRYPTQKAGVTVRLEETLLDGTVLYNPEKAEQIDMRAMYAGFRDALGQMKEGGAYRAWIPAELTAVVTAGPDLKLTLPDETFPFPIRRIRPCPPGSVIVIDIDFIGIYDQR